MCLHTKSHLPNSIASLVTGGKTKVDKNVRVVAILLFCILHYRNTLFSLAKPLAMHHVSI
jgi:hypothetical protein